VIVGFRLIPLKNSLCPTSRFRRIRSPWGNSRGGALSHACACDRVHYLPNHTSRIRIKNSRVMGAPERVPITESTPHFGHSAVPPSSTHS